MTIDEKINQLTSYWSVTAAIVMNASRLNFPAPFLSEALHSSIDGGTVFPTPILQGCSWNTTLVSAIASAIALESRAVGTDVMYSPCSTHGRVPGQLGRPPMLGMDPDVPILVRYWKRLIALAEVRGQSKTLSLDVRFDDGVRAGPRRVPYTVRGGQSLTTDTLSVTIDL